MDRIAREIVPFTTEEAWKRERSRDITSTTVSALFGISPYLTRFELWHRLQGNLVVADEPNERTVWGKRLEKSIAYGAAEDNGWTLRPMREYMRLQGLRIGSSFDYGGAPSKFCRELPELDIPAFLVEVKNLDSRVFREGWLETDFGLEAAPHVELQAQHEMLVSGILRCYIVALVGGNRPVILERDADARVHDRILEECEKFFAGGEPEPDFMADAETIARLCGYAEPGKLIEATPEVEALARDYIGHATAKAQAEKAMAATKAKILREIGDAERVLSPEFTLSAKVVKGGHVEYDRGEYRGFRIFAKGEKS